MAEIEAEAAAAETSSSEVRATEPEVATETETETEMAKALSAPHADDDAKVGESNAGGAGPKEIVLALATAPGYRVQLGSFRTPDGANRMIEMLANDHGDLLNGTALTVRQASIGEEQQVFRVVSDLLPDREAAHSLCDALKGRAVGCLTLRSQ